MNRLPQLTDVKKNSNPIWSDLHIEVTKVDAALQAWFWY